MTGVKPKALPTASAATVFDVMLDILVPIDAWRSVVDAGPRILLAIVIPTTLALTAGHGLGGGSEPGDPDGRRHFERDA